MVCGLRPLAQSVSPARLNSETSSERVVVNEAGPLSETEVRDLILEDPDEPWRTRYGAVGTEEIFDRAKDAPAVNVPGRTEGQGA